METKLTTEEKELICDALLAKISELSSIRHNVISDTAHKAIKAEIKALNDLLNKLCN